MSGKPIAPIASALPGEPSGNRPAPPLSRETREALAEAGRGLRDLCGIPVFGEGEWIVVRDDVNGTPVKVATVRKMDSASSRPPAFSSPIDGVGSHLPVLLLSAAKAAALASEWAGTSSLRPRAVPFADVFGRARLQLDCAPEAFSLPRRPGLTDTEYRAEVDAACDAEMVAYGRRFGLSAKLLERVGPAGGNPVWEFSGALRDLRRICVSHVAGFDAADGKAKAHRELLGEAEYLLRGAQPA